MLNKGKQESGKRPSGRLSFFLDWKWQAAMRHTLATDGLQQAAKPHTLANDCFWQAAKQQTMANDGLQQAAKQQTMGSDRLWQTSMWHTPTYTKNKEQSTKAEFQESRIAVK